MQVKVNKRNFVVGLGGFVAWEPKIERISPRNVVVEKEVKNGTMIWKAGIFPLYDRAVKSTILKGLMPRVVELRAYGLQGILIEENYPESTKKDYRKFLTFYRKLIEPKEIDGVKIEFHLPELKPGDLIYANKEWKLLATPVAFVYDKEKREQRIAEDIAKLEKYDRVLADVIKGKEIYKEINKV